MAASASVRSENSKYSVGCPGARVADKAGVLVMGTIVAEPVGGDTKLEGKGVEADRTAHAANVSSRLKVINR